MLKSRDHRKWGNMTYTLQIMMDKQVLMLEAPPGSNLREVLLAAKISPYTALTRVANCGGRGLCATCGVWIETGEPAPQHWHDRIGSRFGYPRLSCQVTVDNPMTIRILTDKWIWGGRKPHTRTSSHQ